MAVSIILLLPGALLAVIWTGILLADAGILWANVTPQVKYLAAAGSVLVMLPLLYAVIKRRRGR